jgi:HEPN domain-containing protein
VGDGRWPLGEAEVQNLIDEGEIEEVEPSQEHADLLMRQAETHLASAPALLPADPPGAFAVLYDAARKSLCAVLAKQGLRATSKNGHRATQEAIEAQLGPNARKVVRPFRSLRTRRHDAEYPRLDTPEITADEAEEALNDARRIVEAMKKFLPNVGSWRI